MNSVGRLTLSVSLSLLAVFGSGSAAPAQDALGTNMGLPTASPGVLWPRGMSIESLSPNNLYPNGPQFPLGNTSGGFGTTGTGPISGVGLAQRSVSGLVQQEMERPNATLRRLSGLESAEALQGSSLLSKVLGTEFRTELLGSPSYQQVPAGNAAAAVYTLPSVESVLHDQPATTQSILRTDL